MSDVLGVPPLYTFDGRDYKIAARTQEHKAFFKVWLEKNELDGIRCHEKSMTPRMMEAAMSGWRASLGKKSYAWGATLSWEARWDTPGRKYLAYLALREHQAEVSEELIERIFETEELLTFEEREADKISKWQELITLMDRLNDPNLISPEPTSGNRAPE